MGLSACVTRQATLGEAGAGRYRAAQPDQGSRDDEHPPQLWVDRPGEALLFYAAAFGATVLHCVGEGDDIVAQLEVGGAPFWIAPASSTMKRLSPREIDGATGRTTLVVEDPDAVVRRAVAAGATETSPVGEETVGGSAGSSTRSARSGRSARPSGPGRRGSRGSSGGHGAAQRGIPRGVDVNLRDH